MSEWEVLLRRLSQPAIEYRPELRWWMAEGLHTDATIQHEIAAAHRLGFGGMEFLAVDESGVEDARYGWGSEEWVHDSRLVLEETTRLGMSVSFTSGANWSNANIPNIDPDHPAAAQELDVVVETVRRSRRRSGELPRIDLSHRPGGGELPSEHLPASVQTLVAVVAAPIEAGEVIDPSQILDLTNRVRDGRLDWTPPSAEEWRLFVYWRHGTGQISRPSASVNYAINYLDRAGVDALRRHWEEHMLTPEVRELIARNPRAQMYMDSLELSTSGDGGLLWSEEFPREFRARRGYDIAPWLPLLTRVVPFMAVSTRYHHQPVDGHRIATEEVRFDYARTLTDLYIENMLRPFASFLHDNGLRLRAEISYGLPFELTRPGPEVDGIETESLEFGAQIDAYRLLGGPAHLFDRQYSSETGATTRNGMLDHRFYDQIIATQLAAGITKTVLHGWAGISGAVSTTSWPGHEGMSPAFGERFDTRQPGSEFYPLWNDAVGRMQLLLREGRPRIDVGILRTDHFADNTSGLAFSDGQGGRVADEDAYGRRWMRDRRNHWWQDLGMQDAGWTYEFLDGSLLLHTEVEFRDGLVQPSGPGYQALIVYQSTLDADVACRLVEWARSGLRIVLVHGAREVKDLRAGDEILHRRAAIRTPGRDGRDAELGGLVRALLALPTTRETTPDGTLDALRDLGVVGRAEFAAPNPAILSHLREDGELFHLYLYHFLYESDDDAEAVVLLPGSGAVSRLDAWTGEMIAHLEAEAVRDRTAIRVSLQPGASTIVTMDRGRRPRVGRVVPEVVVEASIPYWNLQVESWDAGDDVIISEDRGLGYVTEELRPQTRVTVLRAGTGPLRPWSEHPEIGPAVSGVGSYHAEFRLEAPLGAGDRITLDLGSTAGGLGSVRVNGSAPRGFATSGSHVDITDVVHTGTNTVEVRVSSSLNNRLIARGYYDEIPDVGRRWARLSPGTHATRIRPHGLLGPVRVVRIRGRQRG